MLELLAIATLVVTNAMTLFALWRVSLRNHHEPVNAAKRVSEIAGALGSANPKNSLVEPDVMPRVSAFRELQTLAQEFPEQHCSILDITLAYLRERRGDPDNPWKPFFEAFGHEPKLLFPSESDTPADKERIERRREERAVWQEARFDYVGDYVEWKVFGRKMRDLAAQDPEDVKAAIAFLKNRSPSQLAAELRISRHREVLRYLNNDDLTAIKASGLKPEYEFDLRFTPLWGANLEGVDLRCQWLCEARLEAANLRQARLDQMYARGARMEGADMHGASLVGASLSNASLEGADLYAANLRGAFIEAHLTNATLWGADCTGAEAGSAEFVGCNLGSTNFMLANLCGARFAGANLGNAVFFGANLAGASFSYPLHERHQEWAADRLGQHKAGPVKNLTQAQIDVAFGDAITRDEVERLGLVSPDHWSYNRYKPADATEAWYDWRQQRGLGTNSLAFDQEF